MVALKRAFAHLDTRTTELERGQARCRVRPDPGGARRNRLAAAGAVAVAVATIVALSFGVSSASATIAKVQAGTYLSQAASGSITPTLAAASTAGNLLAAIVA